MTEEYIQSVIAHCTRVPNERIIFVTVGPSGAGKSHLVKELTTRFGEKISVHSLDDYRTRCNNGKYPDTPTSHDTVNKIAIPMYREAVNKDQSRYIVLDNTHLRWDPDWQLPLHKAKIENYDLFTILPPVTEYFLVTKRGTHLGQEPGASDIFRKMTARWCGFRMRHFLNRRISCKVLNGMIPQKPDSFSINKMFHLSWGANGYIYVLDNYLGFIDRDMVNCSIKAGNLLPEEFKHLFLQKDSLLHITLIQPKVFHNDVLKNIARKLVQNSPAPRTHYTGVHLLDNGTDNKVLFMTVSGDSQAEWRRTLLRATCMVTRRRDSFLNRDGLHVTLGFEKSDIWNVNKVVSPKWRFPNQDSVQSTFFWRVKTPLIQTVSNDTTEQPRM